jgi:RsiW-degrading membrane proteinase PrsW (M82 family)
MWYTTPMSAVLLYIVMGACGLGLVRQVWRQDLYDREPWWLLGLAAVGGALLIVLAGLFEEWADRHGLTSGAFSALRWSIVFAASEEFSKLVVVVAIALTRPRDFNDPLDGLVYGSTVGVGAALMESAALIGGTAPTLHMIAVEPIRLLGHLVMGGITCYGAACLARTNRVHMHWSMLTLTLAGGVLLHSLWDVVSLHALQIGRLTAWHTGAMMTLIVGGYAAYRSLVSRGLRRSAREFAKQAED